MYPVKLPFVTPSEWSELHDLLTCYQDMSKKGEKKEQSRSYFGNSLQCTKVHKRNCTDQMFLAPCDTWHKPVVSWMHCLCIEAFWESVREITSWWGNQYVSVLMAYFTKYFNLYALPDQQEITVAKCLFGDCIIHHGIPHSLLTDQGCQFDLDLVEKLFSQLGKHIPSTYLCHGWKC